MSNQDLKNKIFKDSSVLLFGRLVQMLLQLINGLLIPKLISPLKYGLWRSLFIIYQYATFSNLGTYAAIGVEMPYLQGKAEQIKKERIKNNTFYFNVFISLFLGLCLIISSFFTYGQYSSFYRKGFVLFSILIFFTNISDYYLQISRIEKQFKLLSTLTIIQVLSNLILSFFLLNKYENELLLAISIIFSNLLLLSLAIPKFGIPKFFNIELKEIFRLIRFGFPLLFNGILLELFRSVDQLLIVFFFKPEAIGYYGLAIAIQRIGFLIPGVLASTTMPHIYEEYGKTGDINKIASLFEKSLILISIICTLTLITMQIFVPVLIRHYLHEYIASIPILNILITGMFSIGLLGLPEIIASITGKIPQLIKVQIFITSTLAILIFITIKLKYGIVEISCLTSFFYFIYTVLVLFIIYKTYLKRNLIIFYKITELYLPYFYILLIYFIVNYFFNKIETNIWNDIMYSTFKLLVIILFYIPVLFLLDKKYSFIKIIKDSIIKSHN